VFFYLVLEFPRIVLYCDCAYFSSSTLLFSNKKTICLSLVSLQVEFNWYKIFHRIGVSMVQPGNVFYSLEKLLFFCPLQKNLKGIVIDLAHNFVVNLEGTNDLVFFFFLKDKSNTYLK
jgi:hypothetical protein